MNAIKILITGITGFIGNYIANAIADSNTSIYGISRHGTENNNPDIIYINGPIEDSQTYKSLPDDIDICIHGAVYIPVSSELNEHGKCIETNIKGTYELINQLYNKNPNTYVIYLSTSSVYKPGCGTLTENSVTMPETFYALSKLYSEQILLKSGLRAVSLRFTSVYDSEGKARLRQKQLYDWIDSARQGRDIIINKICSRNYLNIEDVAASVKKSIYKKPTGIYNIASSENISTIDIAEKIVNEAKSNSKIIINTQGLSYSPFVSVCIDKAKKDLDFSPNIDLITGIRQIIDFMEAKK